MDEEEDRERWSFDRLWPYRRYGFDTAMSAEAALEMLARVVEVPRLTSGFRTLGAFMRPSTTLVGTAAGNGFHLLLARQGIAADVHIEAAPYGARVHVRIHPAGYGGFHVMIMVLGLMATSFAMLFTLSPMSIFAVVPLFAAALIASQLAAKALRIDALLKALIGPPIAVTPDRGPYR